MRKAALVLGITFLGLGTCVLVFADGLRRWYSGIFFLLIGAVVLLNARFRKPSTGEKSDL